MYTQRDYKRSGIEIQREREAKTERERIWNR